ncbi:hypothetical protein GCM10011586_08320 [Silvibacterium dinghuense]|nr:hypothetical protein GCM10011586_08320 [Silvibacterium dinghuense]
MLAKPCFGESDPWQSLKQLKPGLGFVFIERSLTCQYGELEKVTDTNVSIKTKQGTEIIHKADLMRIRYGFGGHAVANDNPNLPLFTLYSGRSSWSDILAFVPFQSKVHPYAAFRFTLTTKDGRIHRGILNGVSAEQITLADKSGNATTFLKKEIVQVDYITEKPLSDTQEFYWDELGVGRIFDPQLYPRLFHLADTMSVTLYQSARAEDDSVIICK